MANDQSKAKPAKAKKERKFHPIRYLREMLGELKKLTWLTPKELLSHTLAVFAFVLGMALIIYVLDLGFSEGLKLLARINIG